MTTQQQSLSRKYLLYKFFTNLWFVGAIWLYFYRIFITDQQIGLLDGMAFAIGLIAEVPSGALADKFGRDKLVRLGQVLVASGFIMQGFGSEFLHFLIGQTILMIGMAFISGADEALFFEKLNFDRSSTEWRKLLTRGSQMILIASLIAYTLGSFLQVIDPRIPWILTGICFIFATIIIWPIKDTRAERIKQGFLEETRKYLLDIRTGFAQFRLPKLWIYVPIIIAVQGIFYATGWGLLRLVLLDRFHFSPIWGSLVVASSSLITVALLSYMHEHAQRVSEKQIIAVISLSAAVSLLLAIGDIGIYGYFVILVLHAGEHLFQPFISEILNHAASEEQRATTLSVASFLKTLPYILLAPIIGYLNSVGQLAYFLLGWSILICMAIAFYLLTRRQDMQIKLAK